jgi:hypothetical protein
MEWSSGSLRRHSRLTVRHLVCLDESGRRAPHQNWLNQSMSAQAGEVTM